MKYLKENYSDRKTINVEDIQDIIEEKIKENKFEEVYTAFSEYRKRRAVSRNVFAEKEQHKFTKAIEKIADHDYVNDDSCKSYNTIEKLGNIIASEYAESYIIDNKYTRLHKSGNIYIQNKENILPGKLESVTLYS